MLGELPDEFLSLCASADFVGLSSEPPFSCLDTLLGEGGEGLCGLSFRLVNPVLVSDWSLGDFLLE